MEASNLKATHQCIATAHLEISVLRSFLIPHKQSLLYPSAENFTKPCSDPAGLLKFCTIAARCQLNALKRLCILTNSKGTE